MANKFVFSSESVGEGHPDKVADLISDSVLDACLAQDRFSRVACETMVKSNMVILAGEITTKAKLNYEAIVRAAIRDIGYVNSDDVFHADTVFINNYLTRQSPEARRLFALVQAGIDSSDPINFAPYYAMRVAPGVSGAPLPARAVVAWNTTGDPMVPAGTGYAFARAAGALPFLPPSFAVTHAAWAEYATPQALYDALGGKTPNQVLIDTHTLEGVARLERTRGGARCSPNYKPSALCVSPPAASECARAIADADWLAEGANAWDAAHPAVPLRLARVADLRVTDPPSLGRAWAPRIAGAPFAPDAAGWRGSAPLLGVLDAYIQPGGQHVFVNGDPCKAFDDVVYHDGLLVRFLATQGKDLYVLSHPTTHRCLERETCPFD